MKVKVKLTVSKVIRGSVWLKGSEVPVEAKQAKAWVELGEAEYVKAPRVKKAKVVKDEA